ncbi:hypothetical protein A0J61_05670 [Choanephora cucurbitarum]|uniref:Uncharacterized protein n=1 Tax=Choanephora cucurbitarum TaxID=101091 RepID=A0A1C7NCI7_9FUNG|nr:hypothetical protein A0J61_05670 [Choanephora cucurbitarum]
MTVELVRGYQDSSKILLIMFSSGNKWEIIFIYNVCVTDSLANLNHVKGYNAFVCKTCVMLQQIDTSTIKNRMFIPSPLLLLE